MEPIDKTAIVGDTVILPCRVENKVGTLQCKYPKKEEKIANAFGRFCFVWFAFSFPSLNLVTGASSVFYCTVH